MGRRRHSWEVVAVVDTAHCRCCIAVDTARRRCHIAVDIAHCCCRIAVARFAAAVQGRFGILPRPWWWQTTKQL